jgi:hypothetical protein
MPLLVHRLRGQPVVERHLEDDMALKVTIKHPSQGPNEEFEVPGVGMVKNGGTLSLTEEDEQSFFARTGMKVKDYYKDNEMVEVGGSSDAKLPAATTAPEKEGDS